MMDRSIPRWYKEKLRERKRNIQPPALEQEYNPWSNSYRPRCTRCDKIAYVTEEKAKASVEKIAARGVTMFYYLAPCGFYHLSRKKQRGRR